MLDGLQDPGNLGTLWRTADAFGADGLLLLPGCADPWSPKTLRATMGACFRLPVWEGKLEDLLPRLARAAFPCMPLPWGGHPGHPHPCLWAGPRWSSAARAGGVAGGAGGSEKTLQIPMTERCESLNAAAAGTGGAVADGVGPVG